MIVSPSWNSTSASYNGSQLTVDLEIERPRRSSSSSAPSSIDLYIDLEIDKAECMGSFKYRPVAKAQQEYCTDCEFDHPKRSCKFRKNLRGANRLVRVGAADKYDEYDDYGRVEKFRSWSELKVDCTASSIRASTGERDPFEETHVKCPPVKKTEVTRADLDEPLPFEDLHARVTSLEKNDVTGEGVKSFGPKRSRSCSEQKADPIGPFAWPSLDETPSSEEKIVECSPEKIEVRGENVTGVDDEADVETANLQEERETGSFSYIECSDDDMDLGAQVFSHIFGRRDENDVSSFPRSRTEITAADMIAAYQLLNMRNMPSRQSREEAIRLEAVSQSGNRRRKGYESADDMENLSGVASKLSEAVPRSWSPAGVGRHEQEARDEKAGKWTVQASKNSGRFRLKRVKRGCEAESSNSKSRQLVDSCSGDDNEVLDRPRWKRKYRLLRTFY